MNDDAISSILIIAVLLLFSAYFSATETAFSSLNRTRLRTMAEKGNSKAALALSLAEKYDQLLSSILVGNNVVNIAMSSISTLLFVRLMPDIGATVCLSFPLGILSAKYQNTWADRSISLFCFAGNSFPGFFTALLLLYFFSLKWNLFPVLSMGKGWKSCVLPAATLAVSMTAKYTRQVRSAVLAELEQEYVAGARARGLSENRILFGNVLKSVLLRMVTLLFLSAGSLLGGTAIVETIFMWNGVGKMAVDAVSMHDIPVIQAYLVWMAAIYLLLHLIADLLMGALDPRAKLEGMR